MPPPHSQVFLSSRNLLFIDSYFEEKHICPIGSSKTVRRIRGPQSALLIGYAVCNDFTSLSDAVSTSFRGTPCTFKLVYLKCYIKYRLTTDADVMAAMMPPHLH